MEVSGQNHFKEKEMQEAKWFEEPLQIAEEKREAKEKSKMERYTHLNA